MHKKRSFLFFLLVFLFMEISACSWVQNPFSRKGVPPAEEVNCQIEGHLFFRGKAPNHLPVLQNEKGQWRLTGLDQEKMAKHHRKKVLVQGICPEISGDQIWLLPEIQVFNIKEVFPNR